MIPGADKPVCVANVTITPEVADPTRRTATPSPTLALLVPNLRLHLRTTILPSRHARTVRWSSASMIRSLPANLALTLQLPGVTLKPNPFDPYLCAAPFPSGAPV
jgi:hypothetical protein